MKPTSARLLIATLMLALASEPARSQVVRDQELFHKSQQAAQQALDYYGSWDDRRELRRLADIGYRIAQESKFTDFPFTFYLVDMAEPNAFALPGGQIFLTRGMLNLGLDDDMLAGLLGHEIGHVVLKHGLRIQRRATLLNVVSQALLVGVIIGASKGDNRSGPYDPYGGGSSKGDLIQGTAAAGAVISELLLRSYSREFEDEADDEGQRLAAAAGFDPRGTGALMDKMRAHMPQSREYGYWRTHPFFEDRVRAASVRQDLLKIQQPKSADAYRARTQATLLEYLEWPKLDGDLVPLLKAEALVAWPQGSAADQLRLEQLHALRDAQLERKPLSQQWRQVLGTYEENLEELRELTPETPLVSSLEVEVDEFEERLREIYPKAVEVFSSTIYETEFLETFAANFPQAPEIHEVSLALGEAYARLGRETDAVAQFLRVRDQAPESPAGQKALVGLRSLAPRLDQLGGLEHLASQTTDAELQTLAQARLAKVATEYKDLANGAEYLREFPDGRHAQRVEERLNVLADALYAEVVLYQSVGDHVKGIERIQRIFTHAPHSPAAERLRERMVLEG